MLRSETDTTLQASRTNLRRLFAPASVAVVGASNAPGKAGHQALLALEHFPGEVFPINPKRGEVLGRKAFASLRALPGPVDLVLFAVPAASCVEAVREAIATSCSSGLIFSAGFREAGPVGAAMQAELAVMCARSSFRLLGPNTAGFVNREVPITASFLVGADRIPSGEVAVVAQSAGINLTLGFLLAKLGYGVSCAVGLGNAVDVGAADVLEYLAEQPGTKAIALHLEGVGDGRRLYDTLKRVTPRKPVAVLTVGRHDVAEFAHSHTGNLIGSFALRVSALRQAGAVVVETTEELASAAAALALGRLPPSLDSGIGVVTAQAGAGLIMLDHLKACGVSVPPVRPSTEARIVEKLPGSNYAKNPVDTGRPDASFGDVAVALAEEPQIDALIVYALNEPATMNAAQVLPAVASRCKKRLVYGTMGPSAEIAPVLDELRRERIFVAQSPEQLARIAAVLVEDAKLQARLQRSQASELGKASIAVPSPCDEHAAKQVLEAIGVSVPKGVACASRQEVEAAFARLTKPVVVKILTAEVSHKSEVGGVLLGVSDERELWAALERLDAIPLVGARRYLLEETAPPGLEVIVGALYDASFGPTVMVGSGGVHAEVSKDIALRAAPLTLSEAQDMLDELRCAALLNGFRGAPPLDRSALARVIVSLGDLLSADRRIKELEINPLRVYQHGVVALDGLLTVEPSQ